MKLIKNQTRNLKSKTLGLALAAALIPVGLASANDGHYHRARSNVSGSVEVVHQIPGGVITVGADWGRERRTPPPVVVVQQQPQVIVVEERHRRPEREVTIIREAPRRDVTIIRREPECRKEVVVVEKRHGRGHHKDHGNSHYYRDDRQVSYDRNDRDGQYHYYEDARMVSIDDNRDGQQRHVYVRK